MQYIEQPTARDLRANPANRMHEAAKLIQFLKAAFGAEEAFPPMKTPDGKIMHAEVKIGDSQVMLGEASDQHPATQSHLHLYVKDVDAVYKRATAAGGTSTRAP